MRNSFSPFRNEVFACVAAADIPVSAEEIHSMMNTDAALSTTYRALWFLKEKEMVEEIPVSCIDSCGKRNFFIASGKEHNHFFHCEKCHVFIKVSGCAVSGMCREIEKDLGAAVHRHILYFTGICKACRG